MRALAAECGMANEFRFKDYPNEMKFTPVTDDAIGSLAAQYGLEFSADYRAFLKSHNGFYFDRMTAAERLAPGIETFDFTVRHRYRPPIQRSQALSGVARGLGPGAVRLRLSGQR